MILAHYSLHSMRSVEVVGEESSGAREGDTRPFFLAHTTSNRLLRRLIANVNL